MKTPIIKYICRRITLLLVAFFYATAAMAQCAICRDATAGSAPTARAGLRVAIPVLGIPALALFAAMLVFAIRKDNQMKKSEEDSHAAEAEAGIL